jgi:hypothetical protein
MHYIKFEQGYMPVDEAYSAIPAEGRLQLYAQSHPEVVAFLASSHDAEHTEETQASQRAAAIAAIAASANLTAAQTEALFS